MTESSTLGEYAAVYGFARTAAKLVRLPCGDADCHVASLLAMTCKNLLRVRTPRTHYRGKFPPVCAFTQQRPFAHAEAPPSFAFHRAKPPLQPLTRFFLQHGIARHVLATADTLLSSACHCKPRSCNRAHVLPSACHCEPVRTLVWQSASPQRNLASWHYFGQIRMHFPVFALGAALCFVLPQENGLSRRFAPRNDRGGGVIANQCLAPADTRHVSARLARHVLANADAFLSSACHCEPVRTLVRQSASPQGNFTNWQFLGQIRMHFPVFAQSTAFCHALPQEMRIATSLRSSQ